MSETPKMPEPAMPPIIHSMGGDFCMIHEVEQYRDAWRARFAEAERLLAEAQADANRWNALHWYWEDERDMGSGGRWWTSIVCDDKPKSPADAIDAALRASREGVR